MALIECPECGREISDKVKACPHCGYPLDVDLPTDNVNQPQQVEITGIRIKKGNFTKTIIIIVSIIVVALLAYFGIKFINEKKAQQAYEESFNTYVDNLFEVQFLTIIGGADSESLCNLTALVWRNAIYEERDPETDEYTRPNGLWVSDFNIALGNLFRVPSTISTIDDIESNQSKVQNLMKELQTPPEGLQNCYDTVTDLYTAYKGLTDLAINPSGSLTSFSETKNDRIQDFMDAFEKLENQIPEKFDIETEET
ncbi:MAG: zinc-ribbon domain-containing protein [Candidatus Helarchaeota archaeon]